MNARDRAFFTREYNNRELVPEHPQFFTRWAETSARVRATLKCHLDRRYGDMPGETMDIFPAGKGGGTGLMFIHGGYWRALDKKDQSFLAPAWVDAGVSVAVVNYDLCPGVTIETIVQQMLRASRWLWRHAGEFGMDAGKLHVAGHSAGGHLVAMLMSALWPAFDKSLPRDLWRGGIAISGLYDLRPMMQVDFLQPDLRLDEASALKLSPAYLPPATRAPVLTAVGGDESSEFHRQNALLRERWKSTVADDVTMPGRNHFSILDAFAEPASALFSAARRLMK